MLGLKLNHVSKRGHSWLAEGDDDEDDDDDDDKETATCQLMIMVVVVVVVVVVVMMMQIQDILCFFSLCLYHDYGWVHLIY